jgi:uncharacterized membrane protein
MSLLPAWLWFAAIALVFWGITGVTQKLATNRISSELSFIWFAYAMMAISATLVVFVPIHWHLRPLIFWAAVVGGTLNGLGALTSFTALESGGKASVVISLISWRQYCFRWSPKRPPAKPRATRNHASSLILPAASTDPTLRNPSWTRN